MESRSIICCRNLGYSTQSDTGVTPIRKWDVRELSLELYAYDRVRFIFKNNEQKEVLLRLFLQKLKPKTGSIIIHSKTHIYSDSDFWEGTDKKISLKENMKSKLFSHRPWFGGQRTNLETLIDRLGLGGQSQYIPVNQFSFEQKSRLKILMMIAAKTKIILIDKLFSELDERSFILVKEWLDKFSGIIILFGDYPYEDCVNSTKKIIKKDKIISSFGKVILFFSDGTSKTIRLNN